ncbi:hypothetical protein ACFO26_05465 [Lactococcus nasutitermitis]|uniref:Uncharacterized protein n=1 Tax=Lactococcus nasutitermitis TaxID=1652957 RepID=A0ABV9JCU7_9LACT|nr:hypothetical protein [Lactococcus nasutitermitis]
MTFISKNKLFKYTVTLDISQNIFKVYLVSNPTICGSGETIEDAVKNLEALA